MATACALGYLDLRLASAWRAKAPRLAAFLDACVRGTPAFEATKAWKKRAEFFPAREVPMLNGFQVVGDFQTVSSPFFSTLAAIS